MDQDQPSNAPDAVEPNDADTAARVLTDQDSAMPAGGGGLGSRTTAAADPLADATPEGTAASSPIDVPAPDHAQGSDALAGAEARLLATEDAPAEPRPASQ